MILLSRIIFIGVPGEIRTRGLRIRNPALYPAELRGHRGEITPGLGAFAIAPLTQNAARFGAALMH